MFCKNCSRLVLFFFLVQPLLFPLAIFSQPNQSPVSRIENRTILESYRSKAESYVAKNLYRFGLLSMQEYDASLDSFYQREVKDTVNRLEKNFLAASSDKKMEIESRKKMIREFTLRQDELSKQYNSLLRKSLFAFLIWLAIVLAIFQFRRTKLRSAQKKLDVAQAQLNAIESRSDKGEKLISGINLINPVIEKLSGSAESLRSSLKTIADNLPAGHPQTENIQKFLARASEVSIAANREQDLFMAISNQENDPGTDPVPVNINNLCEQYLEIAHRGIQSPGTTFNCTVTKDLEKNLPTIKLIPPAAGILLLNVLHNAFLSVKDRQEQGIKGYLPKIAVSTRILPRFLQIRIKDNGTGMNDDTLSKINTDFFSTRPHNLGPGLGLPLGSKIFNEKVKGEIKIESEPEKGTDVYIKFFT